MDEQCKDAQAKLNGWCSFEAYFLQRLSCVEKSEEIL